MAKSKTSGGKSGGKNGGGSKRGASAADKMNAALREAGAKAAELSQNPVARSMLAAGLVTAAAALTSSKRVRDDVRQAGNDAVDNAEAAADSASKIGAAIVTAATEAVRRLLAGNERSRGNAGAQPSSATATPARKSGGTAGAKSGSKTTKSSGTGATASAAKPAKSATKTSAVKAAKKTSGSAKSGGKPGKRGAGAESS